MFVCGGVQMRKIYKNKCSTLLQQSSYTTRKYQIRNTEFVTLSFTRCA